MKSNNSGWQTKAFSDVFDLKQGKHLPLIELNGGSYPVFGANGLVGYYNKFMYEVPTLLVTCRGATCGSINSTQPFSWVTGNAIALIPKEKIIHDFFYYQLKHQSFRDVISGSAQPQIIVTTLSKKKILVPPLTIQKQIAEILEKTDQSKQKRKEANKLTDEFLQSVFIELFGDPVKNPKGWETKKIKELVSIPLQNGAYFTEEKYTADDSKGIEMVHMSDAFYETVKSGGLKRVIAKESEIEKYELQNGDILIARRSLTFEGAAKACLVKVDNSPLIYESSFIRIRVDSKYLLPIYLFSFLSNDNARKAYVLKYVTSSTISGINQTNLSEVGVLIPPLSLQQQFSEIVNKTVALKEKQKQSEQELENLFQSLMQKAFKGELV